jgi:lactoylglutathione lyase
MKLNHLNLIVTDVPATSAFLEKYFGLKPLAPGNANMAFMADDAGLVLIMFKGKDVTYPQGFHVGFLQDSEAEVNAIHQRLTDDGYAVPAPSRNQGGRWTFYMDSPGGFVIEVEHVTFGG